MSRAKRMECMPLRLIYKVLQELGLVALYNSPRDVHLLIVSKFLRMVGFGQVSIILVQYFKLLGISEQKTGLFMSSALLGDVAISFLLTVIADGVGRKRILVIGSLLMGFAGLVFAYSENFSVLLAVCIIGLISPSGNDLGPFKAIEESSIAHILPLQYRSDVYGWYGVIGGIGASCGSMSAGWITQLLEDKLGYSKQASYKVVFINYAFIASLKVLSSLMLSKDIELEGSSSNDSIADGETERLVQPLPSQQQPEATTDHNVCNNNSANLQSQAETYQAATPEPRAAAVSASYIPKLSVESKRILVYLSLLFALDAFASSMSPTSWISYYIERRFDPSDALLGSIFFAIGMTSSISSLGGLSIARRLGPLLTMVVTHLPSSIILGLIPFAGTLKMTVLLLVLRACTQTMDTAPKQAFLASVVLKNERTVVMGFMNLVKTASQILGTYITGFLVGNKRQWLCFILSGSLKVSYDIGILIFFVNSGSQRMKAVKPSVVAVQPVDYS